MTAYVIASGLFYLSVAVLFLQCWIKRADAFNEEHFLDKTHTDAIKGIAAVGIVISHIAANLNHNLSGLTQYYVWAGTSLSGFGVDLFFFASGYGNCFSARKQISPRDKLVWLGKRVANILIVYLVCYLLVSLVLLLLGETFSWETILNNLINLKMPLSLTWYLKIQVLLYVVLVIALFMPNKTMRFAALVGLSLALTVICHLRGLPGQWWKSTMCFSIGYYSAEYRDSIYRFIQRHRKQVWWCSLICFPVLFVIVNPIDGFLVKVLGNALLVISAMAVAELIGMNHPVWGKIGTCSLEIYLVHIAFSAWFLREHEPTDMGVVAVIAISAVLSIAAKSLDRKLSVR